MEEDLFLFGWKKLYIKFSLWVSYEISYIFLKVFFPFYRVDSSTSLGTIIFLLFSCL